MAKRRKANEGARTTPDAPPERTTRTRVKRVRKNVIGELVDAMIGLAAALERYAVHKRTHLSKALGIEQLAGIAAE